MKRILMAFFLVVGAAHADADESTLRTAVFGGGNFWYTEADFDRQPGVVKTTTGYMGGKKENPSYQAVISGMTGYREVVQVTYDVKVTNYAKLLASYWHMIDPSDQSGQFCDRGDAFVSIVYYGSDAEQALVLKSKDEVAEDLGKVVTTRVDPLLDFYAAEEFHQDFRTKNKDRYKFNRTLCRHDLDLKDIWGRKAEIEPEQ